MSLFDKWWDAANALDREKMANLLDDRFVMVRHQTGEKFNKEQFLDYIMTGIREQVNSEKGVSSMKMKAFLLAIRYLMAQCAIMRSCFCAL